jgi:hypothetical protein
MASAAATTSLPGAILRTLFNQIPDAKSLQRSWGEFGWDLLRNVALPASAALAAKAHPAAPAPAHAAAPHAKSQGEIRMLFDVPPGTRISSRANGTAFQVGVGTGTKLIGGGTRSATSCAGGESGIAPTAAGATAQAAPAGAVSADATPADPTRLNSPQALKAMTDLQKQLASKFTDVLTPESEYRLLKSPERNIKSKFDEKTQTVSVLEDENGIPYKEGETVKSGAKYVPVDFAAFYKDLLYVTKDVPNAAKDPNGADAAKLVQAYFKTPVPLIPQEGNPETEAPQYHGTFFDPGKVMYMGKDLQSEMKVRGKRGDPDKEVDAIYFNPAAAPESKDHRHISAALTLLHEMDHAVAFGISPIGLWALANTPTIDGSSEKTDFFNMEEQRVMISIPKARADQLMVMGKMDDDTIAGADKILDFMAGQGVESATAKRLGEYRRKQHTTGDLVTVPADPDAPGAHSPPDPKDK